MPQTQTTTTLTREDADNAYLVKISAAQLCQYLDGAAEINEIIEDFDTLASECQVDVKRSGKRRFIMIEVTP
jgi:hypothetical protein